MQNVFSSFDSASLQFKPSAVISKDVLPQQRLRETQKRLSSVPPLIQGPGAHPG